jgi:hypothetical protein
MYELRIALRTNIISFFCIGTAISENENLPPLHTPILHSTSLLPSEGV